MQITCQIHNYAFPFRVPIVSVFLPCSVIVLFARMHTHIYPQLSQAHNDSGFNVSIRSMYLDKLAFAIGRLYIMLGLDSPRRINLPIVCSLYIYRRCSTT